MATRSGQFIPARALRRTILGVVLGLIATSAPVSAANGTPDLSRGAAPSGCVSETAASEGSTRPTALPQSVPPAAQRISGALAAAPAGAGVASIVKNINPAGDSEPFELTPAGSTLYFTARDGSHGRELWRTDGTGPGTKMVKDIRHGAHGSFPRELTAIGNTLYFTAQDGSHGRELWKTDGTAAGTRLVEDLPPSSGSAPHWLSAAGDLLYFAADDGSHGSELWKSDGTPSGTRRLTDISPAFVHEGPTGMTLYKGFVYFSATDGIGRTIWRIKSEPGGAHVFRDTDGHRLLPSYYFHQAGGLLYFNTTTVSCSPLTALWRTNGTSAGTRKLEDTSYNPAEELTGLGGQLYYIRPGDNGRPVNRRLNRSDGTVAGTGPIIPKVPTPHGTDLNNIAGTLFFIRDYASVWTTDATPGGTIELAAGALTIDLTGMAGLAYFGLCTPPAANQIAPDTSELWASDGTAPGTGPVAVINTDGCSPLLFLTDFGGTLFFSADDGSNGVELSKYVP